jgi:hypothetical protein
MRIVREDGVLGLFRGGGPTVVRAMALNMGMLASNDQAKEMIENAGFAKGGSAAVLGGATIAGAPRLRAGAAACAAAACRRRGVRCGAHVWRRVRQCGGARACACGAPACLFL